MMKMRTLLRREWDGLARRLADRVGFPDGIRRGKTGGRTSCW